MWCGWPFEACGSFRIPENDSEVYCVFVVRVLLVLRSIQWFQENRVRGVRDLDGPGTV